MRNALRDGFDDRLQAQADARKALLAKFQPKPTVTDPQIGERAARMILDRLEGRDIGTPVVDLGYEIVVRESA